jgi:hypothetical protein
VASNVNYVSIEVYPRDATEHTNKARYGEASHYRQPITAGAVNAFDLRLPLRSDVDPTGDTGYVNGYITYNGGVVDPSWLTVRAFTTGSGPDCGVEGFSASADSLAVSSTGTKTYYRIDGLAGGRCNAPNQRYSVKVTCTCTGTTLSAYADIVTGAGLGLNFGF